MGDEVQGEYEVDHDERAIYLSLNHIGDAGVEVFETDMPLDIAEEYANSILACIACAREGH